MADLRITPGATTEQFARLLADNGRPTPWAAGEDGTIFARNRKVVLVVDPDREQSDGCVLAIALALVTAVNTCAGLKAVRSEVA